jgi:ADP-ribose pyrophosphatase YjhB (NUDIX family)
MSPASPTIGYMARMEYYHDVAAPQARELLPAAYAIVRNDLGQILLVRRADDMYWELPGGRVEVGESASTAVVREVAEEAGVTIKITGLAGVYSDPGHVLAYPGGEGLSAVRRVLPRLHPSPQRPARSRRDDRRNVGRPRASNTASNAPGHASTLGRRPGRTQPGAFRLKHRRPQPCHPASPVR